MDLHSEYIKNSWNWIVNRQIRQLNMVEGYTSCQRKYAND
jgi:hypothetical protein